MWMMRINVGFLLGSDLLRAVLCCAAGRGERGNADSARPETFICAAEMEHLKSRAKPRNLRLEDGSCLEYPQQRLRVWPVRLNEGVVEVGVA